MIEITLGVYEKAIAKAIGRGRNIVSMRAKTNRRRDGDQPDELMHVQGMGAEMAVAKAFNVFPDLTVREGKLPSHDVIINGRPIQVKSTRWPNGRLLVHRLDETVVYVLVRGELPAYKIAGYMDGNQVARVGRWEDPGKGACWVIDNEHLRRTEDLTEGASGNYTGAQGEIGI